MSNSYRLDHIYNVLLQKKTATVEELSELFHVTPTTIRRDLLEMEDRKLVYRTRGAAFLLESGLSEANIFMEEKKKIADAAAKYVGNGMSIALDSVTTVNTLAERLIDDPNLVNLDFVTHSPEIALSVRKRFNVSIPGGSLLANSDFMVGVEVEEFYRKVNVDVAFLGSVGVCNCSGLTVSYPLQLPVKKYSALCADKRIALLDSSKFSRRGIYVFCEFADIDILITAKTKDNEAQLDRIAALGVEIVLV